MKSSDSLTNVKAVSGKFLPSSVPELAGTLGSLLRTPYRRLQRRLYEQLAQTFPEVRRAHSSVFRHLAPEGTRLTDLAEQAEMTKQSMAYLVGHLEKHGYVRVTKHPLDGRATLVKATAKGDRFLTAALEASRAIEAAAVGRMGRENVAELRRLLKALDQAMVDDPPSAAQDPDRRR